ncbi:MAG: toprim domain-containing protein [Hyphomicrobiaceae bacterium]
MGLSETHAHWLEDRGLCVDTCSSLGIASAGPNILLPYTLAGQKLYDKLRDPRDKRNTRCLPQGIDQTSLWLEDSLSEEPKPQDVLIITEGEFDAAAVKQLGYQFVVSLPSGASNSASGCQSKALRVLTVAAEDGQPVLKASIAKFRRVLVMTDGDHDGLLMRKAIIDIIGDEFCLIPEYPDGTKDANDVLREQKLGAAKLREIIEGAKSVRDDGFVDFMTASQTERDLRTYEVGLPFLADHLKLAVPEFLVIGGLGGVGKSTIYQNLVFSLIWHNPGMFRASILHLEGSRKIPVKRAWAFWKRMAGRDPVPGSQAEQDCRQWIADHLAYISPPQDVSPSFDWLMWTMERQALQHKRNVFVIDPWNEIMHTRSRDQSLTEYVAEAIIKMKRLADRLKLILIVCHHCRIPREGSRPPTMYDLSDSQHWGHKADHVLLAWRPSADQFETRIEVAKSKDYDTMGRPGHAWVKLMGAGFELVPVPDPIAAAREAAKAERAAAKELRQRPANDTSTGGADWLGDSSPLDGGMIAEEIA